MNPVVIGNATLYLGDCMEILPTFKEKSFDLCLTDPPYGLGVLSKGPFGSNAKRFELSDWDDQGLSREQFEAIKRVSNWMIVWGYNHLADILGPCTRALVWDKWCKNDCQLSFADCELAYSNLKGPARTFHHRWMGGGRDSETNKDYRYHPTQKPIAVMNWCLSLSGGVVQSVIDPFMGSGSAGVAAVQSGLSFVGIEREPEFFDAACLRIEEAQLQTKLDLRCAEA